MSKRVSQLVGAGLLILTLGVVSCQTLFSGTYGLPRSAVIERTAR